MLRAQNDLYAPLSGPNFSRAVAEGSMHVGPRPKPPRNTSFPLPRHVAIN